ncbi:GGDEF domain-containing protein [Thiocystis violascens]|uniref:diguanylate cyclase n=1 Tax=Thiocystis violascens (strain ATCC 17096 / DSM 198 / 6111) TaxID=765911 RepID=I3Y6S8_THIV6|nr:GGDEF domain-containing protein [Thiocystis violascens]AFL72696.1 diguanylate cyclase (GGDEF) domain-containing protein [Thiocystis violascens DSM 198]
MNLTSQADTPHLTLVTSAEQTVRQQSESIDPIRFLQAITASLDLDQVLNTLSGFLYDLVAQSGWEYRHAESDLELSGGKPDRHRLEYALTLNGQEMGTLKLMRGRRFSETDQIRIEGLLGLAAQSLHNALRFYDMSQQLERDPLTGLGNRRALTLQGVQWLADNIRHKHPLSMLVMDLDRFKAVNDNHGHPVGDRLLCALADTLRAVTRTADLCVRIGGDEFVVLLPGTDLSDAMECAERIRCAVAKLTIATVTGEQVNASVSIGVATYRHGMDLDQLYHQADSALYAAKRAGCNRVLAGSGTPDCKQVDSFCVS